MTRATILDALQRTERILRDCVRLELSPAAWDSAGKPYLAETGPVWEGAPGTHPLLPFLRAAISEARK